MLVAVRRDGSNLCNLGCDSGCFCVGGDPWVATCCDVLGSLGIDGAGEDGGCCCTVTGYHLLCLLSDILGKAGYDSQ